MTTSNPRSRIIAAGVVGNVLEWYDFAVFGYFAAVLGRHFFPAQSPTAQILATFGVFAIGFLMRPLGGALIGAIGDRHGRRAALNISIVTMAVPTVLIGLLPGYETLGILAPALLVLLRMMQGLSVGGEFTASMVFVAEHAAPGRQGLTISAVAAGAGGGLLLGSAAGALLNAVMTPEALAEWGWRIPFLFGAAVALAGFLLRRHMVEAPSHESHAAPLRAVLRTQGGLVARMTGLAAFAGVAFYLVFVYLVSWLQAVDGIAPATALEINTLSMALLLPMVVLGGWLADRFGHFVVMRVVLVAALLATWPLFWLMHHPEPLMIQLGQLGFVVLVGLYLAPLPVALIRAAPADLRCTTMALGQNLALGALGGCAPLVAAFLIARSGDEMMPAFIIMATTAVSLVMAFTFRDQR